MNRTKSRLKRVVEGKALSSRSRAAVKTSGRWWRSTPAPVGCRGAAKGDWWLARCSRFGANGVHRGSHECGRVRTAVACAARGGRPGASAPAQGTPLRAQRAGGWDFLALDQHTLYACVLTSFSDRRFTLIGRRDIRALVVLGYPRVSNKFRIAPFTSLSGGFSPA